MKYFASLLSEDEHQRANSFKFPKEQQSFTISRGILRCLLGKYLRQDPQSIEIIYGLWGKPCVSEEYPLHFNLSHSKDHVLYAVTRDYEVGIDLEYIDETLDFDSMALSLLSPQELKYWRMVKPEEKTDIFFKIWVYKEAFLKASGKGWLHDKQSIPLEWLETLTEEIKEKSPKNTLTSLYFFESIPDYKSALCIEGPPLYPFHFVWSV